MLDQLFRSSKFKSRDSVPDRPVARQALINIAGGPSQFNGQMIAMLSFYGSAMVQGSGERNAEYFMRD
jgi:hypothetical protein